VACLSYGLLWLQVSPCLLVQSLVGLWLVTLVGQNMGESKLRYPVFLLFIANNIAAKQMPRVAVAAHRLLKPV
jgi:hypothetical protein